LAGLNQNAREGAAKFLKKRHRKKHDDNRWSAGPRSFEVEQRAGHIITGSSGLLITWTSN
jgi:hypothetical protein